MTGKGRETGVEGEISESWPGVCVAERWWIVGSTINPGSWNFVLVASVHLGRLQMMKSINSRGRERVWLRGLT